MSDVRFEIFFKKERIIFNFQTSWAQMEKLLQGFYSALRKHEEAIDTDDKMFRRGADLVQKIQLYVLDRQRLLKPKDFEVRYLEGGKRVLLKTSRSGDIPQ
jgi:hypothetical protein